jgi:hypothetical protein
VRLQGWCGGTAGGEQSASCIPATPLPPGGQQGSARHLPKGWATGGQPGFAPNTRCPSFRRGGGVAHGPVVRSHAHSLPKRVRRLGLQCALSAKAWERRLLVVDSLRPAEPKTVGAPEPAGQTCMAQMLIPCAAGCGCRVGGCRHSFLMCCEPALCGHGCCVMPALLPTPTSESDGRPH